MCTPGISAKCLPLNQTEMPHFKVVKFNQMKHLFTVLLLVAEGHSHYEGSPLPQSPLKGLMSVATSVSQELHLVDPAHRTNDEATEFSKKLSLRGSAAKLEDRNYEHVKHLPGPAVPSPPVVPTTSIKTRALNEEEEENKMNAKLEKFLVISAAVVFCFALILYLRVVVDKCRQRYYETHHRIHQDESDGEKSYETPSNSYGEEEHSSHGSSTTSQESSGKD